MALGSHMQKSWSKNQSLVALSPAESELHAAIKASAETLGVLPMLDDFGYEPAGEVWGDASSLGGNTEEWTMQDTPHRHEHAVDAAGGSYLAAEVCQGTRKEQPNRFIHEVP